MKESTQVSIVNVTSRPRSFVLGHQQVCVKVGVCSCKKGLPSSVHIMPGCKIITDAKLLLCDDYVATKKREMRTGKQEIAVKEIVQRVEETSETSEQGDLSGSSNTPKKRKGKRGKNGSGR